MPSPSNPSRWNRALIVSALGALVLSRVWLLAFFQPLYNRDVALYFDNAVNGVDIGLVPYRDLPIEYPPLAWWTMATPRWLSSETFRAEHVPAGLVPGFAQAYTRSFRAMMALADVLSFFACWSLARRRRPEAQGAVLWAYVLVTALQPHVIYDRLDMGLLMLLLGWLWASDRADDSLFWRSLSCALLGAGIAYKLIPLVIVPIVVTQSLRDLVRLPRHATIRRWCVPYLMLAATSLLPFAYHYAVAGPGVFDLFAYHGERGLEIESVGASMLLLLQPLGMIYECAHGSGSINLVGPGTDMLARLSTPLLVLVVAFSCRQVWCDRAVGSSTGLRWGSWSVLAAVVVSKVISVQYMLWTLPLLVLLGLDVLDTRRWLGLVTSAVLIAALSTAIYPYLFFNEFPWGGTLVRNPWPLTPDLHRFPSGVLLLRNALLVGWVWVLGRAIARGTKAAAPQLPNG